MNLEDAKQFLSTLETCVIATVDANGHPEAATVGFSVDEEFKILVATNQNTRKATNLAENNKVALVVGLDAPKTVQIEGIAEQISKDQYQERIEFHFENVPAARRFAGDEGQQYYLITPIWLRFTDYTQNPPIFETRTFA